MTDAFPENQRGLALGLNQVAAIGGGIVLCLFVVIEMVTEQPLFNMKLFKIWPFTAGNLTGLLASLARGGLQFMLIIWLQGIYLPLHGVSYVNTPLVAGLYTIPQMFGFLVAGPIIGFLSDRFGARTFATLGMAVTALGFYLLNTLPLDFNHWLFWVYLFVIGVGMGLFFSIMIAGLAQKLPNAMQTGLTEHGVPLAGAIKVSHLPPTSSLFAALLGYNPLQNLLQQLNSYHFVSRICWTKAAANAYRSST